DRRRQRGQVLAQRLLDAGGDIEDVAAYLARDVDVRRRQTVARDERRPIDDAFTYVGDVADVHRRLLPEGHDHVADVVEALELAGGQDEILLVVLRQSPDRRHLVRVFQRLRHLIDRQLHRVQL